LDDKRMSFVLLRSTSTTDFGNPQQCLALVQRINATDTEEAASTLSQLLESMAVSNPEPYGHFRVLEEMRPTLDFVLGTISKRYASRPLPPSSNEEETFRHVVRMWSMMATNYGFVAQRAAVATDAASSHALADKRVLIAHRRMQYHCLAMIEYFRARRELPAGVWRDLHSLYLSAERGGIAGTRVPDPLNETWGAQSPLECYVSMLLVDAASPYSRTSREFVWLVRWASRFAPYCTIEPNFTGDQKAYYALDTEADHGLRPVGLMAGDAQLRGLNTTKLAAHIHAVVSQLKKGVAASSLGLGDDCVQPGCARLLVSLYRPWGLAAAGRKFPRRSYRGHVQVCADPTGIAFYLTGTEFDQPMETAVRHLDFTRTEAMLTLGELVSSVEQSPETLEERALQLGYMKETWDVLDQSVAGFRLTRLRGDSRVEHRQLVGVIPSDSKNMLLAEVSWLQYQDGGSLHAGVSMMPGPPIVAPVKLIDNARSGRPTFRLGFLVPGVPALKTEASLIVPAGWFLADRRLEVHTDSPWCARMTKLLSRGTNFDRISFVREERPVSRENEP
jgi:cyclic-di-GMP-binding protein